jgi:hypothetical protein
MATFNLTAYPPGTAVKVYERSDFPAVPSTPTAAPSGLTEVFSGTIGSDGSVTVTDLDYDTVYLAYGASRYVRFKTGVAPEPPVVEIVDADGEPVTGKHLKITLDAEGAVDTTEVVDD